MFDALIKPKFHGKCKSLVRLTKTRVEMVKKKKSSVCKYLKNDIADLIKNNLDYNAYGRAEGLLVEQKRLSCYQIIEKFCECTINHLPLMLKQRECPEECREAISCLIFAAARLSEVPELRDLRALFNEKYGNLSESFVNEELRDKFKPDPPSKDMKFELMHDIAQEFGIDWDSKALEQKLFKPPAITAQNESKHTRLRNGNDDGGYRVKKSMSDAFRDRESQDEKDYTMPKRNGSDVSLYNKNKLEICREDEAIAFDTRDSLETSSSSVGSVSEDANKPFYYRFIPPPYVKTNPNKEEKDKDETPPYVKTDPNEKEEHGKEKDRSPSYVKTDPNGKEMQGKEKDKTEQVVEAKPKPRSVRSRFAKPSRTHVAYDDTNGVKEEKRDEEEKMIDGLLMHYSKKKAPPTSLQPEMSGGRVHPNLPDYENLAARLAALK
ncbi:uncharacterized protein LOC110816235 [Carica papaya]|uniref:uncharacterized protein LOC110816235 n=1 Tax=Carica papaya TaxID=3649 RepID=UPI000B8C9326|nr:uncharacterized protein LOC110816235 [Carica papaya]